MIQLSTARPAATIMILRENRGEIKVLMMKRSRKSGFFPNAWVFPGGRVDPSDEHIPCQGFVTGLSDNSFAIAGIRECFEEAGIWLGRGTPTEGFRAALNAYQKDLSDAPNLQPDLSRLSWWSWWTTPLTEPKRYDTRFFLCCLSDAEAHHATPDNSELVESRWITPSEALRLHQTSDFFLAPPTLITLQELGQFSDLDALWAESERRQPTEIMPFHRKQDGVLEILFPGHSHHPESEHCGLHGSGVWLDSKRRWQLLTP